MKSFNLNRRAVLRGAGTAMALPLLEAMLPVGKTAFAQSARPPRFIGYFTSCGIIMDQFRLPEGPIATLSKTLSPFENLKDKITTINGLVNPGQGPGGDHSKGCQSYLRASANTPSVDQYAHQAHMASNDKTRFGSLAVGINGGCGAQDGTAPSALCAISWETGTTYKAKDSNPQLLFDKLFADAVPVQNTEAIIARRAMDESVLSAVMDDARKLQQKMGANDRQIVNQYLTSVEELERRIKSIPVDGSGGAACEPGVTPNAVTIPDRAKALSDLTVLALQCDLARYISFMLENGGDYVTYTHLGMPDGHHQLSHSPQADLVQQIDQWMMEELAYLVQGLKDAKDITGASLLDSCILTMSNEVSDGNRHNHDDMPFLIAGSCNGYFKMGQSINSNGNFGDVWVTVLDALGHPRAQVGNSNGMLPEIIV
jgi:Protein of unknown function (DUF1552)